ncbi:PH domain-containing protein [Velocimicrobium porci]|uniref:PH domain-containing protein n=1 Tax=Velocimicrobium porci TaxID=2606634 RepID=A0A6L5Y0T5_9FIRM|nr:PH domain-containing protein [Velocimicrobium porci]MSS63793.1 PH domain-containing protein [Velocimicrobium porci]
MYKEKKRTPFLALPLYFTTYTIAEEKITVNKGFLRTVEDDCYMYKVQDVKLVRSLMERIFGLGTIICYTGDTTDPELKIVHVKNSSAMKEFILAQSEAERIRKRTLHTIDIDAGPIENDSI